MTRPLRVLAAVQLRPIESGQVVMNRLITSLPFNGVELRVLDASLCDEMSQMRGLSLRKLVRLAGLPWRVLWARLRGADALYYTPSGPTRAGCIKDALVLLPARIVYRATILHVHASGIGEFLHGRSGLWAWAARRALGRCTLLVRLSPSTPADQVTLEARSDACIANALPDESALLSINRSAPPDDAPLRLLFVGLHIPAKGLTTILDAVERLRATGQRCELETLGSFNNPTYRSEVANRLLGTHLAGAVTLSGSRFGADKLAVFARADVLVFPSTFDSETLPLVVMEAMAAGLPVIATRWRGIPDLVEDGVTGILLQPASGPSLATAVAVAIDTLAADPQLRQRMGQAGRDRFRAGFSVAAFQAAWQAQFQRLAASLHGAT